MFARHIRRVLREDPRRQACEGWTYLDVRDAAAATVAALIHETPAAPGILVAAPRTYLRQDTDEALRRVAPGVPAHTGAGPGRARSSWTERRRQLGFKATTLLEDIDPALLADLDDLGTSMMSASQVSLLGLGRMGEPIARRLLAALGIADRLEPDGGQGGRPRAGPVRGWPHARRGGRSGHPDACSPTSPTSRSCSPGDDGLLAGWAAAGVRTARPRRARHRLARRASPPSRERLAAPGSTSSTRRSAAGWPARSPGRSA